MPIKFNHLIFSFAICLGLSSFLHAATLPITLKAELKKTETINSILTVTIENITNETILLSKDSLTRPYYRMELDIGNDSGSWGKMIKNRITQEDLEKVANTPSKILELPPKAPYSMDFPITDYLEKELRSHHIADFDSAKISLELEFFAIGFKGKKPSLILYDTNFHSNDVALIPPPHPKLPPLPISLKAELKKGVPKNSILSLTILNDSKETILINKGSWEDMNDPYARTRSQLIITADARLEIPDDHFSWGGSVVLDAPPDPFAHLKPQNIVELSPNQTTSAEIPIAAFIEKKIKEEKKYKDTDGLSIQVSLADFLIGPKGYEPSWVLFKTSFSSNKVLLEK